MRNSQSKFFLRHVVFSVLCFFSLGTAFAGKLIIQDYAVAVRKSPAISAPAIGELKHNETVQEIERQNNFVKVKSKALEGWIPVSAVTTREKLVIKKAKKIESTDKGDVMAAGKGGSAAAAKVLEGGSNEVLGQKRLDEVEATTEMKATDVEKFKSQGGLKPGQKGKNGK